MHAAKMMRVEALLRSATARLAVLANDAKSVLDCTVALTNDVPAEGKHVFKSDGRKTKGKVGKRDDRAVL